eukprot:m.34606 g.34606  ORF g.34606 m.34606 type:complete len:315 (+) comp32001_c0_seq5:1200-2144(+)
MDDQLLIMAFRHAKSMGAIVAKYRFPARDKGALKVMEEMTESLFTCSVPVAFLKLLCTVENQRTIDLYELGQLSDPWEKWRVDLLESHFTTIGHYQQVIDDFKAKGNYFKRSTLKQDKQFEFLATNLHIQQMIVSPLGQAESFYQWVTFGVPSAHAHGFKQGGLKKILASSRPSSCVVGEDGSIMHKIQSAFSQIEEIRRTVVEGEKKIIRASANYQTGLIDSAMTQVSGQVQRLMHICRNEPVKTALTGLKSALRRCGSVSDEMPSAPSQRSGIYCFLCWYKIAASCVCCSRLGVEWAGVCSDQLIMVFRSSA